MAPADLQLFLARVMGMKVLRVGGASAGILGALGGESETLNSLKRTALEFAKEYTKPNPDHEALAKRVQDIEGYVRTLQLTNTISSDEVDSLLEQLHGLAGA